jgi:tetratricopeptide (TPR) repeat protein
MFGNDHAQPAAQRLAQLHSTGQWERLMESARQSLATEPSNPRTHRHLAWAYAKTDRFSEMQPQVEFLLREQSDEPENHQLAAIHFLETGKHGRAKTHVAFLLRARPQNSNFHFLAALLALRMGRLNAARIHIRKTRELAPQWADAAHLEIEIDSRDQREVRHARDRIRRLEETLPLDPRNAQVHANIGTIHLQELDEPGLAEECYRRSLAIDPQQRAVQFSLLLTIFARSLLYRTLMFPVNLLRSFSPKDDFLVSSILLFWGSVVGLYFTPAAWLFERMVLQEYSAARPRFRAPFYFMRRWPIWLRLLLSFSLVTVLIFVLLWKVLGLQVLTAAQVLGWTFGVHFAFVSGLAAQTKIRACLARRRLGPVESIKSSAFVLDRDHTCARA